MPVGKDRPAAISYDDFLQLERASVVGSSNERFTLVLLTGDRILGQPAGYKDERLVWKNPTLGEFSIPLKAARGILRTGKNADPLDSARNDDLVQFSNGDSARGIVVDVNSDRLKIDVGGSVVETPFGDVEFLHFGQAGKPQPAAGRSFRLRLLDGSLLTTSALTVSDTTAAAGLPDAVSRDIPLASLIAIEQLNGPVSWLSSRLPEKIVQIPFLPGPPKPTRMDAALGERPWSDGPKPITFGNRTYARGIGVYAYSRIDYALDGSYKALRTQYCIAVGRNQYADVTVRIKLDGKTVHELEHFRAGILASPVIVEIPATAKLLTLEVDYGANNDAQDRFNWIEPALLRQLPPAEPPAPRPATQPSTRPTTL
ncbi:MAG: NPCBM/NEW2 domain-containing protein [Tepidisphaeraceae bacterium]